LPHPSRPQIFESYMRSALDYVQIAEAQSGPIPRSVDFTYIWGDALAELERLRPHARIINLETAVTVAEDAWPGKGINYRMHPGNVGCISAAGIDCCVLANNHVLDWGYAGLSETLDTLHASGLRTAGAGRDQMEAAAPAIVHLSAGRVLVFAVGLACAGVPPEWAAAEDRAGVSFLDELSEQAADGIARQVGAAKRAGDIVVVSIHWGGNWGYEVAPVQRTFAHRLIDTAAVDVVHGHSSHHPKPIEVYRGKLILYGCGDFLNDYEGISGYGNFRGDLTLMYFPTLETATGRLSSMILAPMQIRHFRLNRASAADAHWLRNRLNLEARKFGVSLSDQGDDTFRLEWK
jgi:poly-gamma-glutamate synthesis protein (capsule biosynthesis protein)